MPGKERRKSLPSGEADSWKALEAGFEFARIHEKEKQVEVMQCAAVQRDGAHGGPHLSGGSVAENKSGSQPECRPQRSLLRNWNGIEVGTLRVTDAIGQ